MLNRDPSRYKPGFASAPRSPLLQVCGCKLRLCGCQLRVLFHDEPYSCWNITIKLMTVAVLLILLSAKNPLPTMGQQAASDAWAVTVKTEQVPNYFTYQGTTFQPFVKISMKYSGTFSGTMNSGPYQDLFYNNAQPVGCVRHHSLDVANGTRGVIQVTVGSSSAIQTCEALAVANAIKRLYLDLYLKDCQIKEIEVSKNSFDGMVQGLLSSGFTSLPTGPSSAVSTALVMLHMVSNPPGSSMYLLYNQGGSK